MTLDFMLSTIPDDDGKLDVLTCIEITSTSEPIVDWCREKRNRLCEVEAPAPNLLEHFL